MWLYWEDQEGVAEYVSCTLKSYDIPDEEYTDVAVTAIEVFTQSIRRGLPDGGKFDAATMTFQNVDEYKCEDLLEEAETKLDDYLESLDF